MLPAVMERILIEGETCWRRAHSERVAFLVDGAQYFAALAAAIERARGSIWMVGWDFGMGCCPSGFILLLDRTKACPGCLPVISTQRDGAHTVDPA